MRQIWQNNSVVKCYRFGFHTINSQRNKTFLYSKELYIIVFVYKIKILNKILNQKSKKKVEKSWLMKH